jgi:membrane protein
MAPRSNWPNDLMLAGAAALATLAIYRHVSRSETPCVPGRRAEPVLAEAQERGRLAHTPLQIPAAGWKDILLRTYQQIDEDRLLATAAGVVFYGLLAIFPAITALVSSYGLFADPSTISSNLQSLALMLPEGSFAIVQDQVARVLAKGSSTLGLTFAFGLLIAIWSANAGMKAVFDALNVVYEEKEKRGFVKLNLMSLSFTIAALISVMLMVGAVVVVPLLLQQVGLGTRAELIIRLGRWPVLVLLLLVALAVLYRYGPSRSTPRWQWLSVGAVAAAVADRFGAAVLVPCEFRRLQRDLRLAWRGHWPDDLDVDVRHHRAMWGRIEFRNRASDHHRFDRGPREAARGARRKDGGYGRQGFVRRRQWDWLNTL